MRISTAQYFETSAAKYQKNYSDTVKTDAQISSGKRIQTASDDPVGASRLIQLQQQQDLLTQYGDNMSSLKSTLITEESVLSSINNALQTASELAIQAGNGGMADADRTSIANQIGEIEKQVLGLLNTKDSAGQYLFAGSKSSTPPYVQNSDGTYTYQGDETQLSLQVSDTLSLASNDTGYGLTEKTSNASRTQSTYKLLQPAPNPDPTAPPVPVAVDNGRVLVSSGLMTSQVAYTKDFTQNQPYTVEFVSSTQFKVTGKNADGTDVDVTSELTGNGTFDPKTAGGTTFTLRGVDFEINVKAKDGETAEEFNAAVMQNSFVLENKPDTIGAAAVPGNKSGAQITSASVTDQDAYNRSFPNGGALIKFGEVTATDVAYSVYAQPYKDGDKPVATGLKPLADTEVAVVGVTFKLATTPDPADPTAPALVVNPQAGDGFVVQAKSHNTQSVLNTLSQLRQALSKPVVDTENGQYAVEEAVGAAISNLKTSRDQNDLVRGAIGARLSSIDIQATENETISLNNATTQDAIGNTDVSTAAIQLTLQQTMLQASQLAFVKISQLTLFSKL